MGLHESRPGGRLRRGISLGREGGPAVPVDRALSVRALGVVAAGLAAVALMAPRPEGLLASCIIALVLLGMVVGCTYPVAGAIALMAWLPFDNFVLAALTRDVADPARYSILLGFKDLYAFALLGGMLIRRNRITLPRGTADWAVAAYALVVLAYGVHALVFVHGLSNVSVALLADLRPLALPVYLYVLGRHLPRSAARPVVLSLSLVFALVAAFGLVEYALIPVSWWFDSLKAYRFITEVQGYERVGSDPVWNAFVSPYGGRTLQRLHSFYLHPNGLAYSAVLPLMILWAGLLHGRMHRLLWGTVAAVILVATLLTLGRGAVIAVGVGAVLVVVAHRSARALLVLAGTGAAALAVASPLVISLLSAAGREDGSTRAHISALEDGIRTVLSRPLGAGAGMPQAGENLYLFVASQIGLLGGAAIAVVLATVAWTAFHRARAAAGFNRVLVQGVGAATAGLAVASLTSEPLLMFGTGGAFWICAGLAMSLTADAPARSTAAGPAAGTGPGGRGDGNAQPSGHSGPSAG